METFLKDYIERIRPAFSYLPEETGHTIASAFFSFKFELYQKTLRECAAAIAQVPGNGPGTTLKKALSIINTYAIAYANAQVRPESVPRFDETDRSYVAISLAPEVNEDPLTLDLDNALLLIYATAVISSPDDEQALEEHRKFVIRMLENYKSALGLH
ncbi:hypothetical protein [Methanoregula sp.]|uniref:hypothetical protein n=1 Tax=Methanoregula sp. TaxID=2052170 RepID=UPI002B80EC18|nr:hypothetical protein [Methanoregula sp.]HVP97417.1 hypothetical protein [Methanoregula sp.]